MRHSIAIIDSDATSQQALRALLSVLNVDVSSYATADQYFNRTGADESTACVLVDAALDDMTGVQLLKKIRLTDLDLPVIVLAADGDVNVAVDAIRHGATDFIEKSQLDIALLRRVAELLRDPVAHGR